MLRQFSCPVFLPTVSQPLLMIKADLGIGPAQFFRLIRATGVKHYNFVNKIKAGKTITDIFRFIQGYDSGGYRHNLSR